MASFKFSKTKPKFKLFFGFFILLIIFSLGISQISLAADGTGDPMDDYAKNVGCCQGDIGNPHFSGPPCYNTENGKCDDGYLFVPVKVCNDDTNQCDTGAPPSTIKKDNSKKIDTTFKPQVDIPGAGSLAGDNVFVKYLVALYRYGVWLAAGLAVIMIMIGGFVWMTAGGSAERVGSAKA